MEVRPIEGGQGFEYDTSRIFGGSISHSFFPSIEKGIRSNLEQGVVAGYPVEGVRAEIYDGKMHPVDFQGHRLPDRRPRGVPPGLREGRPGAAGADLRGQGHRSGRVRRRHHRRPEHQAPPSCWGWARSAARASSRPRCRRPSYNATPPNCAPSPRDAASIPWNRRSYAAVPSNIAHDIIEAARKEREEEK